jgi:hypothetical protein
MPPAWHVRGDFAISCNCDVFCPCVLSLGKARPSAGTCQSWFAFRIAEGHWGPTRLEGRRLAFLLEVPGPMEQGNWTVGLYLDEQAEPDAVEALTTIFTGRAGGPIGWLSLVIATVLGTRRVPITFEPDGRGWRFAIPGVADARVAPIPGAGGDGLVRITNSRYWMAPDVVVCAAERSRVRDWGRNWKLDGKSAEVGAFDWTGP